MTKLDTNEIRKKYNYKAEGSLSASLVAYAPLLTEACDEILELCSAYDEAQKEIERLQMQLSMDEYRNGLLFKIGNRDLRISTLEALLRKLVDKCEFIGQYIRSDGEPSQGRCPICYAGSLQGKHKPDCEIFKARTVLEGK